MLREKQETGEREREREREILGRVIPPPLFFSFNEEGRMKKKKKKGNLRRIVRSCVISAATPTIAYLQHVLSVFLYTLLWLFCSPAPLLHFIATLLHSHAGHNTLPSPTPPPSAQAHKNTLSFRTSVLLVREAALLSSKKRGSEAGMGEPPTHTLFFYPARPHLYNVLPPWSRYLCLYIFYLYSSLFFCAQKRVKRGGKKK